MLLRAVSCRGFLAAILGVLWIALAAPAPAWPQAPPRGVLLIHSYNLGYGWTDELTRGIRAGLEGQTTPNDLSVEFLDARRRGEELYPQMRALMTSKYSAAKIAVIIAADDPALQFLLDYAPDLLPTVPVVFCGVSNDTLVARAPRQRFTGVRELLAVGPFLDLALSLHAPRRIFVVSDDTLTSTTHRHIVEAYGRQQRRIPMIYLDGRELTFDQILASAAARHDVARPAADHAVHARPHRAILHRPATRCTHRGGLGGAGLRLDGDGGRPGPDGKRRQRRLRARPDHRAADDGGAAWSRRPPTCRVETFSRVAYQFDYWQLARYGIDESRLPAATVIIGRPRSFYGENQALIWIGSLFIVGQTIVIGALTWNVVQRRRAERELARDRGGPSTIAEDGRDRPARRRHRPRLQQPAHHHQRLRRAAARVAGGLPSRDAETSVDEIEKAGNQAAALTRQLLAFSRKQMLQARVVEPERDRRRLESMLGRLIGERIALTTALGAGPAGTCRSIRARSSR